MATTFTKSTLATTYKDDFRDSDNYHRILFNSGVGLQARELTQLQTILQNQISRFGNNVFKEGAVVKPGGVNINPKYEFIKLDETLEVHELPTDVSSFVGKTFTGTSLVKATIIEAFKAGTGGYTDSTLYVKYVNTKDAQTSGDTTTTKRMASGEVMTADDGSGELLKVKDIITSGDPNVVGTGTQVTIRSGIYYARGNFVFTEDQSKILSDGKYTDNPSAEIGFKAVEEIITASDNNALYDNQGAVPNVSAPGADRYRIRLTIAEKDELPVTDNFVPVATVVDGRISESIDANQSYNIPADMIATRIKENSGDYEVKPFTAKFELDSENTHLLLKVSDGVVVVDGYRAIRPFPTSIRVEKPTSTLTVNNEPVSAVLGHNVIVTPVGTSDGETKGIPNFDTMEEINLRTAINHGGSTIGTARVKALTEDGSNIKFHLTDIQMNSGQAFRNVKSGGTSATNYFNITLDNSKAVLKQPVNDYSFFELPKKRPQSITNLIYTAQRKFSGKSATAGGDLALPGLGTGEAYEGTSSFIFAKADSDITTISPTFTPINSPNNAAFGTGNTIAGASNIEFAANVQKTQTSFIQKVLTDFSLVSTVESDGAGLKFINLRRADVFSVQEIVSTADSSQDLSTRFTLDNGQRPSRYEPGRLLLKNGVSAPTGNVTVKYKFFIPAAHPSGDYFSVNSYSGQVEYDQIPSFRTPAGKTVNLRDVIDFRPVADSAGNFDTSGSRMIELPQSGTNITANVTYNLAQSAKLAIDHNSELSLNFGPSGFITTPPERQEGKLPLYDITLNPKTLNDSDVSINKFNFRRFTMQDIGKLEKRIDRLEEFTTLNLLEVDTKNLEVLDSAGNNRTKAGFFVDDFKDHRFSSINTPTQHRASVDIIAHQLRAMQREDTIRMVFDSATSLGLGTVRRGDNVYVDYDEVSFIDQTTASKAVQINPFAVTIYNGNITLSPSSDEWRDTERLPDKIIQKGTRVSRRPAYLFNNHVAGWCGTRGSQAQQTVVTDDAILELVDDRLINTTQSAFMRSRKIFFKATGLRPNTRVFTFLDGINISAFTNGGPGEGNFSFYASSSTDPGNTLKGLTAHPDGSTTSLVTDDMGSVSGSFIVPNNDSIQISTGTREFKILDISVDNDANAGSVASAPYTAKGYLDTKQAEYTSTRIIYTPYYDYSNDDGGGGGGGGGGKGGVTTNGNIGGGYTNGFSIDDHSNFGGGFDFGGPNDPSNESNESPDAPDDPEQ